MLGLASETGSIRTTSFIGIPQYAGRACDDHLRRQLWALHSAATTRLELIRA